MSKYFTGRKTERGFSLVELGIVLSIVGIITGAVWFGITAVNQNNILRRAEEELILVKNGVISKAHNTTLIPPGANVEITPALITLGLIPSWAVVDANTAVTPWYSTNGGTFVVWTNAIGSDNTHFRISFYNPPNWACVDLIMKAEQGCSGGGSGCPVNIWSNGVNAQGQANTINAPTLNTAQAANLCAQNPSSTGGSVSGGSIEFDYAL